MEILSIDRGWVGNECGPDRRIGHGYDMNSSCTLVLGILVFLIRIFLS